MAAFRSLTANRLPLEPYIVASGSRRGIKPRDGKGQIANTALPLHLFEWSQSSQDGVEVSGITSVSDLDARDVPTVRVVWV
jgi:hypothetical protein